MNEIELQRWLASHLPDEIHEYITLSRGWTWKDTGREIAPREWLHVVSLVEARELTDDQQSRYSAKLVQLSNWDRSKDNVFKVATLSWQQRTIALMEVLK